MQGVAQAQSAATMEMSASRGGLLDDSFRGSGKREGLLCATIELNKDHIVIEARDASPLADLVRAQAFSQSNDLRAQSFVVEFILETDHLITLQAGAKTGEPLLVMFANVRKLIQLHTEHRPPRDVGYSAGQAAPEWIHRPASLIKVS